MFYQSAHYAVVPLFWICS